MSEAVSVVGLGKLGLCFAAVTAEGGYRTLGIDVDGRVIDAVNRGESPIVEPGLADLIAAHGGKRLVATNSHTRAVEETDVTFVLVGTPSNSDGSFSNHHVDAALKSLAVALRNSDKSFHTFVISSTVTPGSTVESFIPLFEKYSGRRSGEGFGVCYDPEFVALGSVIKGYREPDLVILGADDGGVADRVERIHGRICRNRPPVSRMSITSAEIAKVSLNAYLTVKISFGNMLAELCERMPGADLDAITRAIGLDPRIAPGYLTGGLPYGGPCFPRDTKAFIALADREGVDSSLIRSVEEINEERFEHLLDLVLQSVASDGSGGAGVAVLGLSFKSGTPVLTGSSTVRLVAELLERGLPVTVYDPLCLRAVEGLFGSKVRYASSPEECLGSAAIWVIGNQDREYRAAVEGYQRSDARTVIDCWRVVDRARLARGIRYLALGCYGRSADVLRPDGDGRRAGGKRDSSGGLMLDVANGGKPAENPES